MTVFGGNCFDIVSENIVIVIKTWREGKITITMDLTIRNYIAVRPGLTSIQYLSTSTYSRQTDFIS